MSVNLSYTTTVFLAGVVVGAGLYTTVLMAPSLQTIVRHGIVTMLFEEPAFSAGIIVGAFMVYAV
jgi:hypothetical protein